RVDVRGQLKTWIGDSKPYPELKQYVLKFEREDGISWLSHFGEITDEQK
ncbi:TraE/TraK family type IV conjugative transfer system protein, partial [Enterobacter cloacae]